MQSITNRWNRAARKWNPWRCTATTLKGRRCTNPGRRNINHGKPDAPGDWRCWQHGGRI